MDINGAFPSNYLKAADLQKREVKVTMSHIAMEDVGSDHKPVLYFVGKERGLVLNKTNSMNIASAYGGETDHWTGKPVILYPTWVDFQGRSVEAIRVRPDTAHPGPLPGVQGAAQQQNVQPQRTGSMSDVDDEIPF